MKLYYFSLRICTEYSYPLAARHSQAYCCAYRLDARVCWLFSLTHSHTLHCKREFSSVQWARAAKLSDDWLNSAEWLCSFLFRVSEKKSFANKNTHKQKLHLARRAQSVFVCAVMLESLRLHTAAALFFSALTERLSCVWCAPAQGKCSSLITKFTFASRCWCWDTLMFALGRLRASNFTLD